MDAVTLSGLNVEDYYDSSIIQQEDGTKKQIPTAFQVTEDDKKRIREYSVTSNPTKPTNDSVKVISFKEVLANFEKEHGGYGDTTWIARDYINRANKEIVVPNNGGWVSVELSFETAMKVLLPGHTHDGERKTLLPDCGLTAKDAANNYILWNKQDKETNPLCSGSLNYHLKNLNKKPIFLTVEPINERYDYGKIIDNQELAEGRLVHLDGLHRLVALAILDNPESTIAAYIACKETPKKVDGLGLISRDGIQYN